MAFEFRGSEKSVKVDERTEAPIYRYEKISEVPWTTFVQQPNQAVRIIVQSDENVLPLDVLYIPREHTRLLVGLHGAEFRNTDLPKFQFVRSFVKTRKESLLFISDSTHLHKLGHIGICWYAGDPRTNISVLYAELINSLNEAIQTQETVLVGHSAGGTGAIKIGALIPNSRAISVNPQFAATLYHKWAVEGIKNYVYGNEKSVDDMLKNYPDRFSVRNSLMARHSSSKVYWFTHVDDGSSFGQYANFDAAIEHFEIDNKKGGWSKDGDLIISCNWAAPPNAHALPGTIIPFIQIVLGEETGFELNSCVDIQIPCEEDIR